MKFNPKVFEILDSPTDLLEICDRSTTEQIVAAEKHLAQVDGDSDFDEDLAAVTGKEITKTDGKRKDDADMDSNDSGQEMSEDEELSEYISKTKRKKKDAQHDETDKDEMDDDDSGQELNDDDDLTENEDLSDEDDDTDDEIENMSDLGEISAESEPEGKHHKYQELSYCFGYF